MRWGADTNPLVAFHAKSQLMKESKRDWFLIKYSIQKTTFRMGLEQFLNYFQTIGCTTIKNLSPSHCEFLT